MANPQIKISMPSGKNLAKIFASIATDMGSLPEKIFSQVVTSTVDHMQSIAPVDTGFLRDNISGSTTGTDQATIVSDAPYSGFVNYGTRFQAAQPFFDDGMEFLKTELERASIEELEKTIKQHEGHE